MLAPIMGDDWVSSSSLEDEFDIDGRAKDAFRRSVIPDILPPIRPCAHDASDPQIVPPIKPCAHDASDPQIVFPIRPCAHDASDPQLVPPMKPCAHDTSDPQLVFRGEDPSSVVIKRSVHISIQSAALALGIATVPTIGGFLAFQLPWSNATEGTVSKELPFWGFAVITLLCCTVFQWFVGSIVFGFERVMTIRLLVPSAACFLLVESTKLAILSSANYPQTYWYYWLDALTFGFEYWSAAFAVAYCGMQRREGETTAMFVGKCSIYAVAEFALVISSFVYVMITFLTIAKLGNLQKGVWRLIFHPIYFELTMNLPYRYLAQGFLFKNNQNHAERAAAILTHPLLHTATFGRLFIATFSNIETQVALAALLVMQEIGWRATQHLRDHLFLYLIHGQGYAEEILESCTYRATKATSSLLEGLFELSSIAVTPSFLIFSAQYWHIFVFSDGKPGVELIILSSAIQFLFEIMGDTMALFLEDKNLHLPMATVWKFITDWRTGVSGFAVIGFATMGMTGTLTLGTRHPRWPICAAADLCSCPGEMAYPPPYC